MKRLVICCDGTWNRADQEREEVPCPTNVIRIAYRIAKRAGDTHQIVWYGQGVGTGNVIDRYSGGAFGEGLEDNVHDAYRFLIANYEPDDQDEIYLFGFSRGAFTARSLAGMIRKCGILRRAFVQRYRDAVKLYRDAKIHPDDDAAVEFRRLHSLSGAQDVSIRFVGVWDTVGSLGIPMRGLRGLTRRRHQFHDTQLSKTVQTACHALAIDERRAPFEPTLWEDTPKPGQTIEQVWFCGVHSDIGGGYPERGLSDLSLEWMIRKARASGLAFDDATMQAMPLQSDALAEPHDSKRGLYRMTPGIDRPIGLAARRRDEPDDAPPRGDRTQSVDDSVRRRWDADPGYRPRNLAEYFRRSGDPRGL
jgi:uncharacterized protein (DUF2235 family)